MENQDHAGKILKIVIAIILASLLIRHFLLKEDHVHHGFGYTIEFPQDWIEWKDESEKKLSLKERFDEYMKERERKKKIKEAMKKNKNKRNKRDQPVEPVQGKIDSAIYVTPQTDFMTGAYEASISVYSQKLSSSLWIQDEFPEILGALVKAGHQIMDKGELKLDGEITKWVLYKNTEYDIINLEFYTVPDSNIFYKIQYSSMPKYFDKHRRVFEAARASFKIKKGLW